MGGTVMPTANLPAIRACRPAWNKGRVVGQKRPLMPKHVWAIRVRLEIAENHRDLALFNLAMTPDLRHTGDGGPAGLFRPQPGEWESPGAHGGAIRKGMNGMAAARVSAPPTKWCMR